MKGVVTFPVDENNTKEAYNMDLSKIPNRLRGKPYFCLMKLEQKPGKDKKDKVPYRTNGARADPTNPNHFTRQLPVSSETGWMEMRSDRSLCFQCFKYWRMTYRKQLSSTESRFVSPSAVGRSFSYASMTEIWSFKDIWE